MWLKEPTDVRTDVLIIGGGGAGLRAAIEASKAGANVLVVAKSRVGYACNTAISGGDLSAATGWNHTQDNDKVHLRDTVIGGRFVNDQRMAEVVARGSPQQVQDLQAFGITFFQEGGRIKPALSPGHSYPRTVSGEHHFGHDFTVPLRGYALKMGAKFVEGVWITHLLKSNEAVVGAVGVDRDGRVMIFHSGAVILATGGAGQTYLNTDNAGGITGDGYALAYELGLPLCDMEFVQFYPTALGHLGRTVVPYEPLVVGLGATLRNSLGEDIRERHSLGDPVVMTRDRLARAILREILEGRDVEDGIVMDLTTIPPENLEKGRGLLPSWAPRGRERFIVAPTCHFFMGGVRVNERGQTELEGLWAAGEVCAGVHGANRLGGNALAEIFVFGTITGMLAAGRALQATASNQESININQALDDLKSLVCSQGKEVEGELRQEMKKTMWLHAGIIREEMRLIESLKKLSSLRQALLRLSVKEPREFHRKIELRNMLLVSEVICRAALMRAESRGSHFRSDYPQEDNQNWLHNILVTQHGREMELRRHSSNNP